MTHSIIKLRSVICFVLLIACFGFSQTSSTFSVALLDFNVISGTGEVADTQLGQIMAVVLERELVNSRRFVVVERTSLSNVIDELALSEQGFVGSEEAKSFGEFKGVDIVVYGDILVFPDYFDITAKFVEVASSQISQAPSLIAESTQKFAEVAREFVEEAKVRFPLQGPVVQIEADGAFVRLGTNNGLTQQDNKGIILRERMVAGSAILDRIGSFTVDTARIFPDLSFIKPVMNEGIELQVNDIVRITPDAPVSQPTPQVATEVGTIIIGSSPEGAEVTLNGELRGLTPLTLSDLAPGEYQLELRLTDYQPLTETITVRANETTELSKSLSALAAVVVLDIAEAEFEVLVDGQSRGQVSQLSLLPGSYELEVRTPGKAPASFPLTVVANQRLSQPVRFEALKARLSFQVKPVTATVLLNNRAVDITSPLELDEGTYVVEVQAEGFEPVLEQLSLVAGETLEKNITLTPVATLKLEIEQANFEVLIDGVSFGQQTQFNLSSGSHFVEVFSPDTEGASFEVSLVAGEQKVQPVTLQVLGRFVLNAPIGTDIIAISQTDNSSTFLGRSTENPSNL